MTKRHLLLRLEAPLMAFGTTLIDNYGPVQDFPATSLLTGLIANALGWQRNQTQQLQSLQDQLIHAVRLDREGERLRDYQTADLAANDQGWTRAGKPEGRAGGGGSYKGQHQRYRWYQADASVLVAVRLSDRNDDLNLNIIAEALMHPARPLFIGRKPCIPATPLFEGWVQAPNAAHAAALGIKQNGHADLTLTRLFWPRTEGPPTRDQRTYPNRRNWRSGVHTGSDIWYAGTVKDLAASDMKP
jgi:CRISPR system Cascade subunit CasD